LRKRGYSLQKGILAAEDSRFQPILMTTATTVFGLLPMVVLNINGIAFIKPIALTIVGGLSVSALLSLYFIPLFYFMTHTRIARKQQKKLEKNAKKQYKTFDKEAYTIEGSKKFDDRYHF
jgi:HAE1 family hydrophobic/amphiphilic exporter-1